MVKNSNSKRAAMEMSVGTIVTIVLLMTVLILGLVLVRSIFTSATYNVDTIDQKIRGEINKLFSEDQKIVIYLPNQLAEIKQGASWGVAWAVKNTIQGSSGSNKLSYTVSVQELGGCGSLSETEALNYITLGKTSVADIILAPGDTDYEISRVSIPETAPLCTIRYRINTQLDGNAYVTSFFDVKILSK
jgi:hypothetical protein